MAKVQKINADLLWQRTKLVVPVILIGVGTFMFMLLLIRPANLQAQVGTAMAVNPVNTNPLIYSSCESTATIYAAYQTWHGLPNHNLIQPASYRSDDPAVIARHLREAKERCIDVIVIDWYGPEVEGANQLDRRHNDLVARELYTKAEQEGSDIKIAIMYDVGTLRAIPTTTLTFTQVKDLYMTQIINDLIYAKDTYLVRNVNLRQLDHSTLFIFPYKEFKDYIDWNKVRQELSVPLTLISKVEMITETEPVTNGSVIAQETVFCDEQFDGLYAWVRPTNGGWNGIDWGEGYMRTFYRDMKTKCEHKIMIGGVWPGFDDSLAHWKEDVLRVIPANCGSTWNALWRLADEFKAPNVMINTWNDFEEGSDVEFGVPKLTVWSNSPVLPGKAVSLTAQLADCQDVTYTWNFGDGSNDIGPSVVHTYTQSGVYMAMVAASNLTATITASTTVVVSTTAWEESFDPAKSSWSTPTAQLFDIPGPTAIITENDPMTNYGKIESEVIWVNVTDYPLLVISATHVASDASYTIQLLDKSATSISATNKITVANVITGVTKPGVTSTNIAKITGWSGPQAFTVNVWINGEAKSATFDSIRVAHILEDTGDLVTEPSWPVYLPMVFK